MNREREPLPLMSAIQRDSYCAWLLKLAGRLKGSVPDHLRKSATELSGRFM
jgi:hypothetical protein